MLGLGCWLVLGVGLSAWRPKSEPLMFEAHKAVTIAAGERKSLRVQVGDETRQILDKVLKEPHSRAVFYVAARSPLRLEWVIDETTRIPLQSDIDNCWHCDDPDLLRRALKSPDWTIHVHNERDEPVLVTGWQALGTEGRQWQTAQGDKALPAIELRVVDQRNGFVRLIAF
jgi:hypothetical protein